MQEEKNVIVMTKKELEELKTEAFGRGYDAGYNAGVETTNKINGSIFGLNNG